MNPQYTNVKVEGPSFPTSRASQSFVTRIWAPKSTFFRHFGGDSLAKPSFFGRPRLVTHQPHFSPVLPVHRQSNLLCLMRHYGNTFTSAMGGKGVSTLPEVHSPKRTFSHLKIGHPKRKRSYSNHPCSGAMFVSGRVSLHMKYYIDQLSTCICIYIYTPLKYPCMIYLPFIYLVYTLGILT